jgi:hypothetical protein
MRVVNLTRDRVLADRAWEALPLGERVKGLLGRDGLEAGQGLFIAPCTSIHSFFMRFVFDAVFVAADDTVLHTIPRMKPWRLSKLVLRAKGVLELPAGVIEATGTRRGDRLSFERSANPTSAPATTAR